jgi:3-phosphoshikimate 1-carboxyvinyltransferase
MADGLATLGVEHRLLDEGIDIVGNGDAQTPSYGGGRIDSLGDHRIAMAFAVAALRASDDIVIDNCANVATSFPDFIELATRIGMTLDAERAGGEG